MIIDITPDYNLFIQILFVLFILRGIGRVWLGLAEADIVKRDKYSVIDIIIGGFELILVVWVLFR